MQLLNTTFGGIMSDICENWSTWLKKTRFSYMDENQIQQTLNWLTNIKNIVLDMADLKENQKVADFGCGSGLLGFGVLERFEDKIELIFSDKFQDCLDECKNILNNSKIKSNVKFLKSDILNIKLENDYLDRALTRSVLVHVLDKQQAFSELFRVLKPNGMYCAFEPIISQNTRYYELLIPDEANDYFDFKKAEMEFMTNPNDPLVNFSAQSLDLNMQMAGFNNVVVNVQKVVSKYSPFGYNLFGNEPFVLTDLCSWGSHELKINGYPDKNSRYAHADRQLRYHRENADETDMTAYGYFQWEDGRVYYECMHHYLDLEYYREEPQGVRRILKAFSSFEKEEISSDLFALAYHAILEEEKSKREREELSCFTDEGLRLAGLK